MKGKMNSIERRDDITELDYVYTRIVDGWGYTVSELKEEVQGADIDTICRLIIKLQRRIQELKRGAVSV